jgi:prolyl-tRNA editing enzyme YbaK/EbsC (Cys-tRNA(Pro) deacylase)
VAGSVERVREHLLAHGLNVEVREFDSSTKNSALAAKALGCSVAEIAKSVVFRAGGAVVVVISGDKRVDTKRLSELTSEVVSVASPEEVRTMTGYPIGGVPPFPHVEGVRVFCDVSLRRFEHVWAAGGAPNVVFRIGARELVENVGGAEVDVADRR